MSNMSLPDTYGRITIDAPRGSLGDSMKPTLNGVGRNLDAIANTANQAIRCLQQLDGRVDANSGALTALRGSLESLATEVAAADVAFEQHIANAAGLQAGFVKLTAAPGGSTWNLDALTGYPYLRAVIIDPSTEANILVLPTLGAEDRLCIAVKVTTGPGTVTIDAGAVNIVPINFQGMGMTYPIPNVETEGALTTTEYGVTLLWAGTEWQIIESANRVS